MPIQSYKVIPAAWLISLAIIPPAAAEDGVSANKIIFGQAAAFSGPAGALGPRGVGQVEKDRRHGAR